MNFVIENNILLEYKGKDENVVIPDGVKEISDNVFKACSFIKSVTLPESLESIGESAFEGCSGLMEIQFPKGFKVLGIKAFSGCTTLSEITVTSNLKRIKERAFENCTGIKSVLVEPGVRDLGILMFDGCTALKTLTCLNSNADSPEGYKLITISPATFRGSCDVLVYAPHIAISDTWFKNIRSYAINGFIDGYYSGKHFDEDVLAANRKFINSQRKKLYPVADKMLMQYMTEQKIIPPADIDDVIAMVKNTEVRAALEEYRNANFTAEQSEKLKAKKQKAAEKTTDPLSVAGLKKEWIFNNLDDGTVEITSYKGTATEVVIPVMLGKKKITRIGDDAFNPDAERIKNANARKKIKSVIIPEGITELGESAFEGCCNIENISIPKSLECIEAYAFYETKWYDKLEADTEGDFVIINGILIMYTGEKSDVIVPDKVTAIGGRAFNSFNEQPLLTSVKLPDTLKRLCPAAFRLCTALSSIEIPKSVTQIGCYAFECCYGLTELTIPDGITSLEYSVFAKCDNLVTVHIPKSVKSVKERAFKGCISLEKPELAEDVTELGDFAFYECRSIRQFTIPQGVTSIGDSAFRYCTGLRDITIPESVREIDNFAFSDCDSLTDIVIEEGVATIGQLAFAYGPYYRRITIPASVSHIHSAVFYNDNEDYIYDGIYNGITVIAPQGSYAAQFAEKNDLKCISENDRPAKTKRMPEDVRDEENTQPDAVCTDTTPIVVKSKKWSDQHEELWEMLVPDSGKCDTVQGEVVRIGGKIHSEIMRNAGGNWDTDYMKMLSSLCRYWLMGKIHDRKEYKEAVKLTKSISRDSTGEDILRLIKLNVHWVLNNPKPIPLGKVTYRR